MAATKKVLITGGAGLIGGILIDRLSDRYEITSLDLTEAEGADSIVADISDLEAIAPAFEGKDAVIHLAADRRADSPWDSVLPNNLVGTYNIFEAAKRAGVGRVVFASSNHATGGFYLDPPWSHIFSGEFDRVQDPYRRINESDRIRPDGYYGVAKAYGEALGSYYWDYHALRSIHLRIGWVLANDDPTFSPFALSIWLSHRDTAQIVQRSIDAPDSLTNEVVYATSDNRWNIFSIEKAKRVLGYAPEDAAGSDFTPGPSPNINRPI